MTYYKFSEDVYLVKGAKRHCIYDLNCGCLYSISESCRLLLDSLFFQADSDRTLSESQQNLTQAIINSGLIVRSETPGCFADIRELKREHAVSFAWIEVTRQCNLACTFCYEGSNPHCVERMTIADFKIVLQNLIEQKIKRIQFIGGEPLILKDELKEMIKLARPHTQMIEVYTNGIMINADWCKFFKANRVRVATSVHSYNADEHDALTQQKGSHRKVLRAIELLKKYGIPYRFGTVESANCNVHHKPTDFNITLKPKLPKAAGLAEANAFSFEMFKRKAITRETKKYPINKDFIIKQLSGHQCFSKDIYVNSLLEVYPCVMERRVSYGNLKNNSLAEIINPKIKNLTKDNIEGCKSCEYRYGCFDCRPDSNGRGFYEKPWFCSYNPLTSEWANLEDMYKRLTGTKKLKAIPIRVE